KIQRTHWRFSEQSSFSRERRFLLPQPQLRHYRYSSPTYLTLSCLISGCLTLTASICSRRSAHCPNFRTHRQLPSRVMRASRTESKHSGSVITHSWLNLWTSMLFLS